MAWTKVKTAVVVGASVLLAAGTATTVVAKKNYDRKMYSWRVPKYDGLNNTGFWKAPPQVRIFPTKYSEFVGADAYFIDDTNTAVCMGICASAETLVEQAYRWDRPHIAYLTDLPKGNYDYIANLPQGSLQALQTLVKMKFNLIGNKEVRETDVLVLKLSQPEIQGFKPANSLKRSMNITNPKSRGKSVRAKDGTVTQTFFDQTLKESVLIGYLENRFKLPVIDETGSTNRYDFSFVYPNNKTGDDEVYKHDIKMALMNQLGLELVPSRDAIEMLVVEKAK